MSVRFNPFRPNSVVTPGIFAGRRNEIAAISKAFNQTKHGNPQHLLLEGERGIGKSSLLLLAKVIGVDKVNKLNYGQFNFITLETELVSSTSYIELIHNIGVALKAALSKQADLKTLATEAWDFLSKWSVMGVSYKAETKSKSSAEAITELADTMSTFLNSVGEKVDGILISIDEADKPDPDQINLGEFVKILTEKLTKSQCDRVCLILAGLPVLVQKLKEGHESSLRIFENYTLDPLSEDEAKKVIHRALKEANEKNQTETKIDDDALDAIIHFADGYPHFIHQFGYCAFDKDADNHITIHDVLDGAFAQDGAIDQLGKKYFHEMYFDKVSSLDYREVLNVMAEHGDEWCSRAQIIKEAKMKDTQINNALAALKERNIIFANKEKKGEYRLPTKSFAVWIKANNERKTAQQQA